MKRLALLLLLGACTYPTEPVHQPLEGFYEVLDFYRISTCGQYGAITHVPSDFRLELRPPNYVKGHSNYYAEYQGHEVLVIKPFEATYEVVNDSLRFVDAGQTWLNEVRFAQWRDGTLIGRWEPFCGHFEVTFRRLENGY